ncbi:uncharacterized protein CFP56_003427 [Quercus suber]|uniref:DUF4283 domain-containing protein n=1 Tax=Quercus suber TaxID=58331 RepID=A0AAW0LEF1_QUESU
MVSLKLTSEEEEDIQVSNEGRMDEIEGCALSLIGKFLTCKPFNRKAAKNTLRRAWGLDKELQICEVGNNLFQFKFQSEYELERILRGGPWSFDNQLLMLTRWRMGMSARNVVLEHASLWVQIWGMPFDMMSPTVATEVGNKMGVVEEVERRQRTDDHNFFLRVKVALPIAKPIRTGGFLKGSDGSRHWVTYKYERMPLFCHYCGILGHNLCHCPEHFAASKKTTPVEYQYGDWLKADNGRSRSPTRRGMDSSRGVESIGRTDGRATESNEVQETAAATARVKDPSNSQRAQNGRHGCGGNVIEVQEKISEDNAAPLLNVEKVMPSFTQGGNAEPNLNNESTVVHTTSSTLGHVESKPNKPKATWTRLNRMEVGPPNSVSSVLKPTLDFPANELCTGA